MVKIAALNLLSKIFPPSNAPTEADSDTTIVSADLARAQLAGLEQRRRTPIDVDASLAVADSGRASAKDPAITIAKDSKEWPQIEGYLKKIGIHEDRIKSGNFKLSDIPNPTQRRLTKALLYSSADRSSDYNDKNKNGIKRLEFGASTAKLGSFMLEKYPKQVESLFGENAIGCGDDAMNAAVLENFLGNHLREHQVVTLTPRLTEFNHLASCSMKDYVDAGFSGADLKGIHFPKTDIDALERASRSVVKFESQPNSSISKDVYYPSSAVLDADSDSPGGVLVMTAKHCIDGDAFIKGQPIDAKNYEMKISVDGKNYSIDASSIKTADANGDYVTFKLQQKKKDFDLSGYTTTLARNVPKFEDRVVAIGYPELSGGKKSFAAGSFSRYLKNESRPLAAENNMIVNHGYSGGGVFNDHGELLGITITRNGTWEISKFYPLVLPPTIEIKAPTPRDTPTSDEIPAK